MKSSQEYPVNAGVSQGSAVGSTLFLLYINSLSDVVCNTTLYSKCDKASDLWQQLEFDLISYKKHVSLLLKLLPRKLKP